MVDGSLRACPPEVVEDPGRLVEHRADVLGLDPGAPGDGEPVAEPLDLEVGFPAGEEPLLEARPEQRPDGVGRSRKESESARELTTAVEGDLRVVVRAMRDWRQRMVARVPLVRNGSSGGRSLSSRGPPQRCAVEGPCSRRPVDPGATMPWRPSTRPSRGSSRGRVCSRTGKAIGGEDGRRPDTGRRSCSPTWRRRSAGTPAARPPPRAALRRR